MDHLVLALQLAFGIGAATARCSLSPTLFRDPDLIVVLGRGTGVADSTPQGRVEELRFARLEGGNPARVQRILAAAPDSTIWIRPWSYDAACRRTPWPGSLRWLPQDSTGVVQLQLAPQDTWYQGKQAFDSYDAPREPFPMRYPGYDKRPGHGALTARDYFDFLMALPTYGPGEISALPPSLERWLKAHPDLRERFPVAETLWFWTRRP